MSDFTGFTFNGKHSSELNVIRVSDGSRYSDDVLPAMQDKTVQIPGTDGTYYFGSNYTSKTFNIKIAFDSITEENFHDIRKWLGDKAIHQLVFDEEPFKTYDVKCTGSPRLQYICFDESYNGSYRRIYKGEGDVQLTAYRPFGVCEHKWGNDTYYNNTHFSPKTEWQNAAGILNSNVIDTNTSYDEFDDINQCFYLYNPGDVSTDFILTYEFGSSNTLSLGTILFTDGSSLTFNTITKVAGDSGLRINSKLQLAEGIDSNGKVTGTLYNKYIASGNFFKIATNEIGTLQLSCTGAAPVSIQYNYLYL